MSPATILSTVGGIVLALCALPQVIRVYRLRSAHDLSWLYLILLECGLGLWIGYGVLSRIWPLAYWNAVSAGIIGLLILAKVRWR